MLENTSFEPETGKNRETCRQISVAHLQVFSGAPNSVAHVSGAPQNYNLMAQYLWRTPLAPGCATEFQIGAPLMTLFLLVRV